MKSNKTKPALMLIIASTIFSSASCFARDIQDSVHYMVGVGFNAPAAQEDANVKCRAKSQEIASQMGQDAQATARAIATTPDGQFTVITIACLIQKAQ